MLKKKAKRLISMLVALTLTGSMIIGTSTSVNAIENIQMGEDGYASLHTYTNAVPGYDNVYKVKMSIDLNTRIEPKDIVFVIDNSGSMGYPRDKTTELKTFADGITSAPTTNLGWENLLNTDPNGIALMGAYNWDPGFISSYPVGSEMPPWIMGSWKYGRQWWEHAIGYTREESMMFIPPEEGYRFEWMQAGLESAIELLLDPAKNGAADKYRIAVVAFGDGSTDNTGYDDNLLMTDASTSGFFWDESFYNWGTAAGEAGHVWDKTYSGGTKTQSPYFNYSEEITFSSSPNAGAESNTVDEDWFIKSSDMDELIGRVNDTDTGPRVNLVRRQEGTGMSAGLQAALELLEISDNTNPDAEKYVFILSDGLEQSKRPSNPAATPIDFAESMIISLQLQQLGAKMHGVGVLSDEYSLFNGKDFVASKFNTANSNSPVIPTSKDDYVKNFVPVQTSSEEDYYTGENHLLHVLTPIAEGAPIYLDDFSTFAGGSSFFFQYSPYTTTQPIPGPEYDNFMASIQTHGQTDRINYTRTNTSRGVVEAFEEFARNLTTLSDAKSDVTLGSYFSIYQMPGMDLFTTDGASSASGGGRNIVWNMPDVGASGGHYEVTFYVKLDAPANQADVWQSLFESFFLKFKDFNGNLVKKNFPQSFMKPNITETENTVVDHRLDDVIPIVKKAQAAFTTAIIGTPTNVHVSDTKANLSKNKKTITLSITAKGTEDLYYQWYYRAKGDAEWIKIPGAISSVYNFTNNLKAGDYSFCCGYRYANSNFEFSNEIPVTID